MFRIDDDLEAWTSPGGPPSGDSASPPPSDADALVTHQRELSRVVLRAYDPGVAPWYDGRWELPGR